MIGAITLIAAIITATKSATIKIVGSIAILQFLFIPFAKNLGLFSGKICRYLPKFGKKTTIAINVLLIDLSGLCYYFDLNLISTYIYIVTAIVFAITILPMFLPQKKTKKTSFKKLNK